MYRSRAAWTRFVTSLLLLSKPLKRDNISVNCVPNCQ